MRPFASTLANSCNRSRERDAVRTALVKLYLICPEPNAEPAEKSPAVEFTRVFLPVVDQQLFPPAKVSQSATVWRGTGRNAHHCP